MMLTPGCTWYGPYGEAPRRGEMRSCIGVPSPIIEHSRNKGEFRSKNLCV